MFGIPDPYLALAKVGAVAVIGLGVGATIYIQHLKLEAATEKAVTAEHDRDQWKNDFDEADRVAKANAQTLADFKSRLAESAAAADAAAAAAAANAKKYDDLLIWAKEQHAPSETTPLLRAYLDGLCRQATGSACSNY